MSMEEKQLRIADFAPEKYWGSGLSGLAWGSSEE